MAFYSDGTNLAPGTTNDVGGVFVRDRQAITSTLVSVSSDGKPGNQGAAWPSLSGDGRVVAHASQSSNLVSGDTNGVEDEFVYDRQTEATTRVSVCTTTDSATPVLVSGVSGATAVAAGPGHTCAVITGGQVTCWGRHDRGWLGDRSTQQP